LIFKKCNLSFLSDETPRKDLPIEMILPFHCYHCDKRFKLKPNLKRHEVIHQNERLIKVMKHPFFVKSKSSKKNVGLDLEKIVPSMCLPFMTRNLPKSSKDKLDRPKGKMIKSFLIRRLFLPVRKNSIAKFHFRGSKFLRNYEFVNSCM
jgi:uncharacterized Zn-finger protein